MSETDFELLAARCGEMSVLVVISWIIVIKSCVNTAAMNVLRREYFFLILRLFHKF